MKIVYEHLRVITDDCMPKKGPPSNTELFTKYEGEWTDPPYPRGGQTVCRLLDENGAILAVGVANCSMSDAYNKKTGRAIAYGRALKNLNKENKS